MSLKEGKLKGKLIIVLFSLTFLFLPGCSEEGGTFFNRILSKVVARFSPDTEKKADLINLVTAAEKDSKEKGEKATIEKDTISEDTLAVIAEALHWEKVYYSDRNKPDPFRPLLTEREGEEKTINVDLAKLIGIIWGKNGYLALLKEGNLGYVLKDGDRVTDGRVFKITEDSITFLLHRFGEQNKVTLTLKKER